MRSVQWILVTATAVRLEGPENSSGFLSPGNATVNHTALDATENSTGDLASEVEQADATLLKLVPQENQTTSQEHQDAADSLNSFENMLASSMGNQSTSGLVGVSKNSEGDFQTMRTAGVFNLGMSLIAFLVFSVFRAFFPAVYSAEPEQDTTPMLALRSGLARMCHVHAMEDTEVVARAGLDGLMLLEFMRLGRQLALVWGIVIVGMLCPLHFYLHSQFSGQFELLSMTSFNGLSGLPHQQLTLLLWSHAATVWFVVLAAGRFVYQAQLRFLEHRFTWLKKIPAPRATTLMVENLPEDCRSDEALRMYFARLFSPEAIQKAYVVRRTDYLCKLVNDMESASYNLNLEEARSANSWRSCPPCTRECKVEEFRRRVEDLQAAVVKEQQRIEEAVKRTDLNVCGCSGFVTFNSRRMCMLALSPQYRADATQLVVAMPPDPEDVIYRDLAKDPQVQAGGNLTAAALLLLIFVIWAPLIATFLDRVEPVLLGTLKNQPELQQLVQGVMSTGVLKVFMGFLPTVLMAIINNVLTLKAGTWAQLKLQDWYFAFQVVFVLLVTTIVGTFLNVLEKMLAHPGEIIYLLADALPGFSNFYINYIMLSCFLQVFDLLRTAPLAKYIFHRLRGADPEEARAQSEPEDQDSDGMGARMAKVAIHLVVCVVFASCCPVILVVAWLYFAVGCFTFGYLVIFAETKKPDMGGAFWVKGLRHLFLGLGIYVLLMVGLLSRASLSREPAVLAAGALVPLGLGYLRFSLLSWEALPFEAVAEVDLTEQRRHRIGEYRQPECTKDRAFHHGHKKTDTAG
ncbi:unnamed protein product [Effrenium voratum]|uniref:Uncharacterized protein n=2 Tax=Effrenium voratum TaxID=2562239 RepID=A0AA36I2G3_9DINO|nr:unnamed protein product [Effrenium voratum]